MNLTNGFFIEDILQQDFKMEDYKILSTDQTNIVDIALICHYTVKVVLEMDNKIFMKRYYIERVKTMSDTHSQKLKLQGAYKKEAFIQQKLFGELKTIPGFRTDFTLKCYLTRDDEEMFVLEDLEEAGYSRLRIGMLDLHLRHFKVALDAVAKFHAASIIFEERRSKELCKEYRLIEEYAEYFEEPAYRKDEDYLGNRILRAGAEAVLGIIDMAPQCEGKEKDLKEKFCKYLENIYDRVKPSDKYRNVICKGELWAGNILFEYNRGVPVKAKFFNFQSIRYTIPAMDVISVLHSSKSTDFVADYQRDLYFYYYESLRKHLHTHGIDINNHMSYYEFLETTEYILPFVVIERLCGSTYMLVHKLKKLEDQESFENFVYGDRSEVCMEEYNENSEFKIVMDSALAGLDLLK